MIDTHAHLDFPEFDRDRDEVISRAFDNGVKAIINIGVDLERSRKSVEIAERYEDVFASAGLHPDFFTKGDWGNMFAELKNIARHKKVMAIGETGLDYFHVTHSMQHITQGIEKIINNQKEGFVTQIKIAQELGLPVIVHCRDVYPVADGGKPTRFRAWKDLYEIISEYKLKFVLHCYSGEKKDTEHFLKMPNICFSFSGNITYAKPSGRAEKLSEAVRMVPLDRIMLDSDSPFLAPQNIRGKRNEPLYVSEIAEKIADIREISVSEVEKTTDENAISFFDLK